MDPQIYTALLTVTAALFFVAALITLGRVLAGPNSMDRLVGLESLIAMSQGMLAVYIAWSLETSVAYAMLVIALLGFISSLSVARFRVPDKRAKMPSRQNREPAQPAARNGDAGHVNEGEDHF